MKSLSLAWIVLGALLCQVSAFAAEPQWARWTGKEDKNAEFAHVLDLVTAKTGLTFAESDFGLIEDRDLANNHFKMYVQLSGGVPVESMSIRLWTNLQTQELVQAEVLVLDPAVQTNFLKAKGHYLTSGILSSKNTLTLLKSVINQHPDDRVIGDTSWRDVWSDGNLVRIARTKGKHGYHVVRLSLQTGKVLSAQYEPFPQLDDTFDLPALVYPIYEEVESTGKMQPRFQGALKYINSQVKRTSQDPYVSLRSQDYFERMYNPILGMTEDGRNQGYWAMGYIKSQAAQLRDALPFSENSFTAGGVLLDGKFTTINLHPDVAQLKGISFTPGSSPQFYPQWRFNLAKNEYQMIPGSSLLGRPLAADDEGWSRVARRLPDHDPATYLNDGFDEIQVYYAVNTLFESLRSMGFTDPELSTRQFHAFLYDPDISMRNNAYYTDDTINFTTYSGDSPNMARDNPTIWHELGHGVMDRLMGDYIHLADTGGLSEGMADFVAALVVADVTKNKPFNGSNEFRIINRTGFNLTNEVHDDGEAYGGAMKDLLDGAVAKFGQAGVHKVSDLVLEAMRLCRNHPGLTAQDWFSHILFADELGNLPVRKAGELGSLINQALAGRNFTMSGIDLAQMTLMNGNAEVKAGEPGSRQRPIPVLLKQGETATYNLKVTLQDGVNYRFKYPVQVKVEFHQGALQGAVHWVGEENNPNIYTINGPNQDLPIDLTVTDTCDSVNREDGSCVDYAYVQIWNQGEKLKPQAKKRFYLRVKQVQ